MTDSNPRVTTIITECALLKTPTEVRHAIYSYLLPHQVHVRVRKAIHSFSACLQHDSDIVQTQANDGHERKPDSLNSMGSENLWARRLSSTWGPHWICEENALSSQSEVDFVKVLLVCKQMYTEILDLLARVSIIHMTDLSSFEWLNAKRINHTSLLNVAQLSVTLRLPLEFLRAIDPWPQGSVDSSGSKAIIMSPNPWFRFCSTLSQLKNLTTLQLWLDHDEPCSWSVVNEKAILYPFLGQTSAMSNLVNVSITLPKLHPKFEHENRHFLDGELHLPENTRLNRTIRQRWHCREYKPGRFDVIHNPDFPLSWDYECLEPEVPLEEYERAAWKSGVDFEAEIRTWSSTYENWGHLL